MDFTPPSTHKKLKCPDGPIHSRRDNRFPFLTPVKGPFSKKRKCPDAPIKKVYGKRLFITNDGQRVRIFPFIESNNDTINSCRRRLFPDKPSRIPRLVKKKSKAFI
jgi:hypothetical protein